MSEPDLFDAAGASSTDGYERWRAERLASRQTELGQPDLSDQGNEFGYRAWQEEVIAERVAFEKRWGVKLGKTVRVQFKGLPQPVEGVLRAVEQKHPGSNKKLQLQMGEQIFFSDQIESLVRL